MDYVNGGSFVWKYVDHLSARYEHPNFPKNKATLGGPESHLPRENFLKN